MQAGCFSTSRRLQCSLPRSNSGWAVALASLGMLMAIRAAVAKDGWRARIAVAICAFSAALGAAVVARGTHHAPRDIMWVAAAWAMVAIWLDGFRGLRKTPAQLYQNARQGGLYRSPLHRMIGHGALVLFVVAIVSLFM